MTLRSIPGATLIAALLVAMVAAGCERDTSGLEPYPLSTDPVVFDDQLGAGVDYQAFLNSKLDAISVVTDEKYNGSASLKVVVPGPGDPSGWFAGGAFTSNQYRNLSGYNAIVFWAKASKDGVLLDIAGLGNDNTGTSKFSAGWGAIAMNTSWQRYVIPIPLPAKLVSERGLFFFAEGYENNEGYTFWLDDIMFANVGSITNPRPLLGTKTINSFVGGIVDPGEVSTTFSVGGTDQLIGHMPGYFTFASSADTVVTVADSEIRVVGAGTADVTAKLGEVPASGKITVKCSAAPTTPAPTPTVPPGDVISLFSGPYTDVTVDTWWAEWSHNFSNYSEFKVAGDDVKAYTNLIFAGIEFTSNVIDATNMTHFHLDVWVPEGTTLFKVKLVDFGQDGVYQGAPDSERELTFWSGSTPALVPGTWTSLEIPLADFMNGPSGLVERAHLAQLIVSGSAPGITAFVDNVYFHK